MSTSLYVTLPAALRSGEGAYDYVLSADGRNMLQQGRATAALLPHAAALILLVPPELLSWHAVRLPPVRASRMQAALSGLLEDRLLDDPETLAFALAPQARADGSRTVAALDKAWLRRAMEHFEQRGRAVARVAPRVAPAAADPAQRCLRVEGTPDAAQLLVVDADTVLCLPLEAAAHDLLGDGATLPLHATAAMAQRAGSLFGRPAQIDEPADHWRAAARSGWQLAQFDLAISARARLARRLAQAWAGWAQGARWRTLRWGLLGLLLANLLGLNAWAWRLEADVAAKRGQARNVLLQAFPGVRTVVDAPLQMERELAALRRSSGTLTRVDLEAMLAAAGAAMPAASGATGIEFAGGTLTVTGGGLTPAQWPATNERLQRAGYRARLDGERLELRRGATP